MEEGTLNKVETATEKVILVTTCLVQDRHAHKVATTEKIMLVTTKVETVKVQEAMAAIMHRSEKQVKGMKDRGKVGITLSREGGKRKVFSLAKAQRTEHFPDMADKYTDTEQVFLLP